MVYLNTINYIDDFFLHISILDVKFSLSLQYYQEFKKNLKLVKNLYNIHL